MITAATAAKFIPPRRTGSRKGDNGKVLVVGGGRIYHGAPALAAMASLRSGADLAYVAVPNVVTESVRATSCDVIVIPIADQKLTRGSAIQLVGAVPNGMDSAAVGMGLNATDGLNILVQKLSDADIRIVLDAGALLPAILDTIQDRNCILTPHAGEFRRLFGEEPPGDIEPRADLVKEKAAGCGTTILLKGSTDIISDGRRTYAVSENIPAMTAGGTGDILAGITAGILARNRSGLESAAAAAYVNKQAGIIVQEKIGFHILASDLINAIPQVMKPMDRLE